MCGCPEQMLKMLGCACVCSGPCLGGDLWCSHAAACAVGGM